MVSVKVITDPWIDHLTDRPMGRNPNALVQHFGAHPTCYYDCDGSCPISKVKVLVLRKGGGIWHMSTTVLNSAVLTSRSITSHPTSSNLCL
jgi:hypothetical protein